MCGIAGVLHAHQAPVAPAQIDAMMATLRHRGPDGEGRYFAPGIGLGHERLAVIDLTAGSDQPFVDEAAGLALAFNGEIYNYLELRDELRALGHTFRSDGDTEVLLRAYEEWGEECLGRLNGMFALALWDDRKQRLLLARDRFGEKPLYLARSADSVVFASEMKAILAVRPELRQPNPRAVYRYIARGDLDQDEETFFAGVESLPAAHYLSLDANGEGKPRQYWAPRAAVVPARRAEAIEGFRELVFDAVRLRMRADVPIGSSLSGGLDSSTIVASIAAMDPGLELQQRTFSARFRSPQHDEGQFIERAVRAARAEAHDVWIEPEAFRAEFETLQWHQEEPIASTSPFAQWRVMALARETGTTVLLDGQGADELLGGYDQAHGMFWAHWLRKGRVDRVAREMGAHWRRYRGLRQPALFAAYYLAPSSLRDQMAERYYRSSRIVSPELQREFGPAHVRSIAPFEDRLRNELVRWQTTTQLPEFLRYADRNSMAFGREVRLPFLDYRLTEYVAGLPPELLLHGATTKVVLREALRGIVPDEILERKDKLAYSPPQQQWLRGPLRGWLDDLLEGAAKRSEFFDPEAVRALRTAASESRDLALAWRVASTEAWLRVMIEGWPERPAAVAELNSTNW